MCTRPSVWILMLSVVATIWHNQNACGFMYLKCFKCQTLGAFAIRHSTENECSCPNLNYQGYGKKNVSYETCQTLDPGGNAQLTNQTKPSPLVQLHFMKPPSDIMKVRFTLATQSENTFSSTSRRQKAPVPARTPPPETAPTNILTLVLVECWRKLHLWALQKTGLELRGVIIKEVRGHFWNVCFIQRESFFLLGITSGKSDLSRKREAFALSEPFGRVSLRAVRWNL